MAIETIQQKKKSKKTYTELSEEIKSIFNTTAKNYVEQLCQALRDENPEWTNDEIRDKVLNDWTGYWKASTINWAFPSWIYDEKVVKARKKAWESRHAKELLSSKKISQELVKHAFNPPPEKDSAKEYDEEEPDESIGEPMLESYGDNVESALTLYGNINEPMNQLFYALTKRQLPDSDGIDLILEYLKPSREFRKGIFYEIESDMRTAMYNAMVYTRDALTDTLKLLDEIDKQERNE